MHNEYDIVIAGGGLIGASLACGLGSSGFRVAVLEQRPLSSKQQSSYDDRGIALSIASCRVMQAMGLWAELSSRAVPIRHIHVSQLGRFGTVRFNAQELNTETRGNVVIEREIGEILLGKISELKNIDYICPERVLKVRNERDSVSLQLEGTQASGENLSCKLLVAADGSMSQIRQQLGIDTRIKDYGQTAIVANISVGRSNGNTAYERFTTQGPVALLPVQEKDFVSVRCISNQYIHQYTDMKDADYIVDLQEVLNKRVGNIIKLGKRKMYPLKLLVSGQQYTGRTVFLGNAAHTIHPNGAQGFNLGLRDVAALTEVLLAGNQSDPGKERVLQDYCALRRDDQSRVTAFTDGLSSVFYQESILRQAAGSAAMVAMNCIPAFKKKFARYAMGIEGKQPALVRGLAIQDL
jgi:2-octaprenyl-6-methoxyphenol hydroxylase